MKSCLGILLVLFTFVAVIGGAGLIWYLSSTAEFSRKDTGTPVTIPPPIPKASVPIPQDVPNARQVR